MKGSTFDTLIIAVTLFALGVIVMLCYTVIQNVQDNVNAQPNMTVTTADGLQTTTYPIVNTTFLAQGKTAILQYDNLMPFILVMLIMTSMALAFLIPSHPILAIPSIFTLILVIIITASLSNAYFQIASQPSLQDAANHMPITASIIQNLPTLILIAGCLIMIAMFITFRRPQEIAG